MKKSPAVAAIVLVLLAALLLPCAGPVKSLRNALRCEPQENSEFTDHWRRMTKILADVDRRVPAGATIFLGDSITQRLVVSNVCGDGVNLGVGDDTTVGLLERLQGYESPARAGVVVVAIGHNDLRRRDDAAIVENFRRIVTALPADVPVIFNAVLPTDAREIEDPRRRPDRIAELNAALRPVCEARPSTVFLDAGDDLRGECGDLARKNHVGDGIHLSPAGYRIWTVRLREAVRRARETS